MMYIWRINAWVPFSPDDVIIDSFVHQHCSHTYFRDIIVVDAKGRHHKAKCQFCPCEEEATTLIRHHFWPSSPKKPKMCFDFHIMEMLRVLYLQVPVPVMDFCEALKLIYHPFVVTDNPILQDVYKVLINESFEEYRYFVHQMNTLSGISPNFSERLFECPACPQKDEYPRILSMDANFGLVRKKTSGESVAKPKHEGLYFLDQDEVDKFVRSSDISEPNKDVDCNEFKAGSNIRSKGRYYKLDETAVFGASCRHDFPQMMFSLKHGERLSYPVYLLQQLMEKYGTSDISFMYDISCMFESYIKKHHSDISLDAVKMAIPIFHAYGHKWAARCATAHEGSLVLV
ncbi:uncharacterized protein LOC135488665 [Lineus longissimus]|uniref:uncharacterized protein LOC135488665 n=1 Tax=Lineus longissimus TaxID=88925 RepID=UPI00315CAE40